MPTPEREEITFTREQFYEKVWSMPATKVAAELGISDVMVGKICRSYHIPKPYLGYWAKLEHGKKPKKTPLPKSDDPDIQTLTFYQYPDHPGRETTVGEAEPEYDPDIQQMLDKARALEPVKVADALRNPHPLVAATRDWIKRNQVPIHQRLYERPDPRPTLNVEVSKDAAGRALRIMDALIKRVEKLGGSVEVTKEKWREYRTQTVVRFGGEEVSVIRLREKHRQVRVPPEKKEYEWDSDTELEPSGLLLLDQGPTYFERIMLRDTPKRRRIEDGLNDLVISFIKKAGDLRIQRRREEEARKRREEEERLRRQKEEELRQKREALQKRQKAEQARVDELVGHAQAWRESQLIREYLSAVCDMLLERDGAIPIDGKAARYLRWAHQQADRLDPLRPSPPSVLDERI